MSIGEHALEEVGSRASWAGRQDRPPSVAECRRVVLPPNWRGEPHELTYVFLDSPPSAASLAAASREYAGRPGVRVISPALLGWSALFHPLFHRAIAAESGPSAEIAHRERRRLAGRSLDDASSVLEWLRASTFLAAVTLSAAIVQRRYSRGTIESKYDRLWRVEETIRRGAVPDPSGRLAALDLGAHVVELAAAEELDDLDRLLEIRRLFESAVAELACGVESQPSRMTAERLRGADRERFGFVDGLQRELGVPIDCVIVYGSSVSGDRFHDYDLVVITDAPEVALRQLAGTSPTHRGRELNMGIYDHDEFTAMQLLSGDNLATYGRCLLGGIDVPTRTADVLQLRNFSFGVVRWRQQLGMLGPATVDPFPADGDDRRSLYDYFVKVPANVARGTLATTGTQRSKAEIYDWMRTRCDYDPAGTQRLARTRPAAAIAASAVASERVLHELNLEIGLATPAMGEPR